MFDLKDMPQLSPAAELEKAYRRQFTAKYKTNPAITSEDRGVFQWLLTEFGTARSHEMVEGYFRLSDPFINGRGHPVKLLKTNANQVIASLGNAKGPAPRQKMLMRIRLACDKCFTEFDWVGDHHELEGKKLCQRCKPTKSAP